MAGLTKRFRRGKRRLEAVRDVTLQVKPGEVVGLLGPNGAGKTTTIKMACGLITPTAGTVRLNGYDMARQRSHAVRQVGVVLEGGRNVYWPLSAWQNLLYFGRLRGLPGREIRPRAERLLAELGLWDRRNDTVGSYSRGMQQKVAIGAALITDPPVLMLDEPTIGLDVPAARAVKDLISQLAREDRKAVVLTTHQLATAQELSARIAVISGGTVIADLPTRELLSRYAEDRFEIRVAGPLSEVTAALPAGSRVDNDGQATRVSLRNACQAGLHEFLDQLRDREVPILSVTRVQPGLEEVFLRLVYSGDGGGAPAPGAASARREP
ncbi:MAG: ABC transporter ATP-binding protein [Actinobacteria bacterium]|nr:ABC transporter ATP-binding protein [Actinomycetota bacterium]